MSELDLNDGIIKNARAIIYKIENNNKLFLLTKEPGGFYTVPGGCKETDDKDIVATIKRELNEELNLKESDCEITDTKIQKIYKKLYSDPSSDRFNKDTVISIFIVKINNIKPINIGHEINDVQWLEEKDVYSILNTEHMKDIFKLGIKKLKSF